MRELIVGDDQVELPDGGLADGVGDPVSLVHQPAGHAQQLGDLAAGLLVGVHDEGAQQWNTAVRADSLVQP